MPAMLQRYIGCDKWLLLYSSPFSCRGLSLFLVLIQTSKHNAIPSTTVRMRLSFRNQCSGVFLIALLVNTVTASATFTSFTAHATGVNLNSLVCFTFMQYYLPIHPWTGWGQKGEKEMQSHIQITTARKIPKRHILKWHSWLDTSHGFVKQDCCKLRPPALLGKNLPFESPKAAKPCLYSFANLAS